MNCPACECRLSVVKTMVLGASTKRLQECACGTRVETEEKVIRRLPGGHLRHGQPARNGPSAAGNPSATAEGVGGSLPSGSDPASDPNPASPGNPNRARARSKAPAEYTPEWEREWRATAQTGSKRKAFKAWWRRGCPPLADAWAAWGKLDSWRRGFVPHVVSWVNGDCYLQEPHEVPKNGAGALRAKAQEETASAVEATDRKVAEIRAAARSTWTPEQQAELRRLSPAKRHIRAELPSGETVELPDADPLPVWAGGKP